MDGRHTEAEMNRILLHELAILLAPFGPHFDCFARSLIVLSVIDE